ncbi:HTH domain-containing protein [Paenibacillus sp. EC2-1]|uniref:HTH domain-containing protein n=1 Tax=Paenibacillus sp. EC2-1 TaxID=3388665 RepID=UPI003BEF3279
MNSVKSISSLGGDGDFNKMLERVTGRYGVSLDTLSKITGVSMDVIASKEYSGGELASLRNLLIILTIGMEEVNEDDRVKGVIEVLKDVFGITNKTIALYSRVDVNDIEVFLNGDFESISFEKRYRIAVTTLFLHYLCKPS